MSKRKNKIKKASQYVFAREKEQPKHPLRDYFIKKMIEEPIKMGKEAAENTIQVPVDVLFPDTVIDQKYTDIPHAKSAGEEWEDRIDAFRYEIEERRKNNEGI